MSTQRRLLEFHIANTAAEEGCFHPDTCHMCRVRRTMAMVAKQVLERKDIPEHKLIYEFGLMLNRELRQMPSTN